MTKAVLILVCMALGAGLPWLAHGLPALPWLIGVLLLCAFCAMPRGTSRPTALHLRLLLAAWAVGGVACAALWTWDRDLALGALLAGAAPTAAAAPTVVAALHGRAAFAAVAVLGSNLVAAVLWPLLLIALAGGAAPDPLLMVLKVTPVVALPWALARVLLRVRPALAGWLAAQLPRSFLLWLVCLAIMSATASAHLREAGTHALLPPLAVAVGVCVLSFVLGHRLGRPDLTIEASQCLGQKNTALATWTALVCTGPAAALVPICYILCHNLWNAGQLARRGRRTERAEAADV